MNILDKQYIDLLKDILENGTKKTDRTSTGTISVFGRQIRHKMSDGFPLLTTKKMAWKPIVIELLWFLRGDTNIKYLVDNDCHIWDGDAHKHWFENGRNEFEKFADPMFMSEDALGKEKFHQISKKWFIEKIKTDDVFANKWGELGPIYGKQWRSWNEPYDDGFGGSIDQIQNLINDLKTNPDSRRLMVNAWNVAEIEHMVLPPCHYGFQVYTRELSDEERLSWMKNNKSNVVLPMRDPNVTEFSMDEWFRPYGVPKRAISLMWNQRSVDTFLGLPFNIASYGLLLEIIAREVNMVPDELIGNLGDTHLYLNHIEQAKEQIGRELTWEEKLQWVMNNTDVELENVYITEAAASLSKRTREPYPLPTVTLPSSLKPNSGNWDKVVFEDFYLNNYQSHPPIKAPLSN